MSAVKINNRYLGNPQWLPGSSCNFDLGQYAHIWSVNIPADLHRLDEYSALINDGEHARANRYLHLRDRQRFIISRGVLRLLLGRYISAQPASVVFETGVNKKPFIKGSPIHYNISHSGDMIVIAVSPAETGIDIEWLNPAFDYHDIISEYFSDAEMKYIEDGNNCDRFFRLWTRKEALTKATAKGLDDDLRAIPSLDGEFITDGSMLNTTADHLVTSFGPATEYIASVAIPTIIAGCTFWQWNS